MEHYKNKSTDLLTETFEGIRYVERWEDINGWDGFYQVSSFGRVKSLYRVILDSNGVEFKKMGKILSLSKDKDGYLQVGLSKNGFHVTKKVHRIVGECFIPNTENLPEINHIKSIKTDNRYHQLEWITPKENTVHSFKTTQRKVWLKGKTGEGHPQSKKVFCPTFNIEFGSAAEAERELGLTGVGEVCNGNLIHAKGISFRYIN